ncbi:MAG: FAD-binding oxidoreductase [Novosphingobium sp.]|nr:FAD-binding oxidoreductase [Novosphingobium sp.]
MGGLRSDLAELLGDGALVPADEQERYERGYRYGSGRAAAVVRPADTEGVRTVMRLCRARGVRIVPQGAHTGLTGAATPDASGTQVVLSLERLRAIWVDPLNRTATCGAGTLLSALNAEAEKHGLHLPIDLGADPSLGGMVATNTGGSRLLRYGGMREQVIGLEAVFADEDLTVASDCQGLRKDNVGLDLKQLLVGTGGRFGVVTGVQVALHPVIRQSHTALAVPARLADVPRIVGALEAQLDTFLLACEGMSQAAMKAAFDTHPVLRQPFADLPDYALLVEVGAASVGQDLDLAAALEQALVSCMEGDEPWLADALVGRGENFWAVRHAISDGLKALGRVIGLDISVRRDRLPELRDRLAGLVHTAAPGLLVCDFGHVADGGMHFNLVVPPAFDFAPEAEAALREAVLDVVVREFGGSFSAEHGIGPANKAQYERYRQAGERRLIEGIKALVDPAGVLP